MAEVLSYELRDGVALLKMDDGKANALGHEMITAIQDGLARAEEEAGAVLLVGRDGKFCAGFDLRVMMSGLEEAKALVTAGAEMFMRLYGFRLPVVAACTGHAVAGGALLLLACDTRVGADGPYKIGLNEVSISMTLPIFGQELARDRLDKRAQTEAIFQSRIYSPDEAAGIGYLDRVVGTEDVIETALSEARRLADLPQPAYGNTKTTFRERVIAYIRETLPANVEAVMPKL